MDKRGNILIIFIFFFIIITAIFINGRYLDENSPWESNLTGVYQSSLIGGDINDDGYPDLIIGGCIAGGTTTCATFSNTKVYINNGTGLTENSTWELNLEKIFRGSLALGDVNNDGKLDLALCGNNGSDSVVKVYINNGSTLTENSQWEQNLTGANPWGCSLALGDVNNDGKLDLGFVGANSATENGIYINNGTSFIKNSDWLISLPLVGQTLGQGVLSFGDINNDGYLDLIFQGSAGTNFYRGIYINNGTSLVENSIWESNIWAWGWPSITVGDYDNDGYLDLIAMGTTAGDRCHLYKNNGTAFILKETENTGLCGIFDGSLTLGDYDNDGYLDLAANGKEGATSVHINNQTDYVIDSSESINLLAMQTGSSILWFDLNNDSALDLVETGLNGTSVDVRIYLSNRSLTKNNTLPTPPNNFTSIYSTTNNTLLLTWNNGSDTETNSTGLYYNLMVGNETTNNTIVSGVYGGSSNPTAGYFGNMMQRKNITLNLVLPEGDYYWYVQTIDTGLAKSNWSARQTITVGSDTTAPSTSSISSSVTSSTATITWTTDEMANSTVYYGTTIATSSKSSDVTLTQSHSVSLGSLSASTLYYYNVSSCDDSGNCNISSQGSFTTSAEPVTPPSGGSPGGGSGSTTTSFWTKTETISNANFNAGIEKEFVVRQRIKVNISEEEHYIGIVNINASLGRTTINISSNPIQIILGIGQGAKVNLTNDKFYDIYVKLISILNNKANLTIQAIHEEILGSNVGVETNGTIVGNGNEKENQNADKLVVVLIIVVGAIILIFVGILVYLLMKRRKHMKKYMRMLNKKDKEKKK